MSALLLLIISGTAGWMAVHFKLVDRKISAQLNRFIIFVSLPALTLVNVHKLTFTRESWLAASMPWFLFAVSSVFVLIASRHFKFTRQTTGALLLTAGLGNTSFIGFPLIAAYFGVEGIQTGIFIDQTGTFLILALLGVPIAVRFSGGERVPFSSLLKRVILFPPFIALIAALALRPVEFPDWLVRTLSALGWTLAPLALASVGIQTYGSLDGWREDKTALTLGLTLKLIILPAIVCGFYIGLLGAQGLPAKIIVFEAAMAPMITGSIVAAERGLNPKLCGLVLAIGIPISLITSGIWYALLQLV